MPDANGNFKGISVPKLPPSMERCEGTGLYVTNCSCPRCIKRMVAEHRPTEPPDIAA